MSSISRCWTRSLRLAFLPSESNHPASRELQPCVPVEAFLSRGHVHVDGYLEQQLTGVSGHFNHCGLLPFDGVVVLLYMNAPLLQTSPVSLSYRCSLNLSPTFS